MDDISRCRNQLSAFRIKELKDVLTRLGLPKQGKKQVLMDKILAVLTPTEWPSYQVPKGVKSEARSLHKNSVTREEAAKVIDDIYRKLRGTGAVELASGRNAGLTSHTYGTRSDEQDESSSEIRCVCGSPVDSGTMIQCENRSCGVWQHVPCVIVPETEGAEPKIPSSFFCESCRISSGDPFCVTLSQPLAPVKLNAVSPIVRMEGTTAGLSSVERTFMLTKADRDTLHKANHDLQVWCLLLNDKVPYRMHWPAYAELRVNSVLVRVTARTGQQLLGINGRDDGPSIFTYTREGNNKISLTGYDSRPFCIGIRILRRRTIDQVMNMVPSVLKGEPFQEALARVNRCIGGGGGDAADDSDSDIEVVADSVTVNLSCPMSGSRVNTAGRFKPCGHLGGFDLKTFVELNQKTRKWQCPVCMTNYTLENLIIDPFFDQIAKHMKGYNEDVKEVELKADGLWRPKLEGEARLREPWRNLDGNLVVANGFHHQPPALAAPPASVKASVKVEQSSPERCSLRIGMKRTRDGTWAINRINKDGSGNSNNNVEKARVVPERSFSRSSSATDSNGHEDEGSVNQDPSSTEQTGENGMRSSDSNAWKKNKFVPAEPPVANGVGEDVIVLSSSDEESDLPIGKLAAKQPRKRPSSEETSQEQHYANGSAFVHERTTETGMQSSTFWPQDPTYRFLEAPEDPQPSSSDYGLNTRDAVMDDYGQYLDEGGEDPSEASLRLFLPPQPARAPLVQDPMTANSHDDETTALDGWFSLSLGGCDSISQDATTALGGSTIRRSSGGGVTAEFSTPRASGPGGYHHHHHNHHHQQNREPVANTVVLGLSSHHHAGGSGASGGSSQGGHHRRHQHYHYHQQPQRERDRQHRSSSSRHTRLQFRVQSDESDDSIR